MTRESVWSTGAPALDLMMHGGIPRGRVTAIMGGAGSGKTILASQIMAAQAAHGVRSVFVAFEQSSERLRDDLRGFEWSEAIGDARVEIVEAGIPAQAVITGDFDLEALIAVLDATVSRIEAQIVVLDGIDALLSMLGNEEAERRELFRLGSWLRDNQLTGIVTAKSSLSWPRSLERAALLDYQSDCVIVLDTVHEGTVVSRTLRVSKLRGSAHDGSLVPMLIHGAGVQVTPLGSTHTLGAPRSEIRLSSGVDALDGMLEGGYLQGSATLLSGPPGTAKTSLSAAFFCDATTTRRGLYVAFDETESELVFHMASIGYDLRPAMEAGRAQILALRSGMRGPEQKVADILAAIDNLHAEVVVIDPVSALNASQHSLGDVMTRYLFAELDRRGTTVLCTSLLTDGMGGADEDSKSKISAIADNWLHLTYLAQGGERNRTLTVVKARGTANSNQVRELVITADGVNLLPVYLAGGTVLVGSARAEREAADRRAAADLDVAYEHSRAAAQDVVDGLVGERDRIDRELRAKQAELAALRVAREQDLERDRAELDERRAIRVGAGTPL